MGASGGVLRISLSGHTGRSDVPRVVGDLPETLGPIVAAPSVDLDRLIREMDLHSIAVELDLVKPAVAVRDLLDGRREGGFDEAGKWGLDAGGRQFLPHA